MSELKKQHYRDVKPARPFDSSGTGRSVGRKSPVLRRRKIPWMFVIAAIISVFIATRAFGVLAKKHQANTMNRAYQSEISELKQKEINLQDELNQLSTDDGLEQEIREKFRVTKNGEQLVVIIPQKDAKEADASLGGLFSFLRKIFK